tara:strand:- start:1540 stop:1683 length:144 start_codon:yes stop_codon:yes gene_type:complete
MSVVNIFETQDEIVKNLGEELFGTGWSNSVMAKEISKRIKSSGGHKY